MFSFFNMLIDYFIIVYIGLKNSGKDFFTRYSLSTVTQAYLLVAIISKLLSFFLIWLRSLKGMLETRLGYQFSDFQDAFAVSSLFLTLLKVYVYLVFSEQISPIVGILILILNFIFALRHNLILVVRELVTALFVNPFVNIKPQFSSFNINKLLQGEFYLYCLFLFLIAFRIFIYSEPLLMLFFNFLFIYYLLFHKLLFIVFFYSLILSISRFAFLSSDYTLIKLYHKLNNISNDNNLANPLKRIKLTKKNIIILGSWITRTYEFRDIFLIYKEEEREKSYSLIPSEEELPPISERDLIMDYIATEIMWFMFAINSYNSRKLHIQKIKVIPVKDGFKMFNLFTPQIEIIVKPINFLFYLITSVLLSLYFIPVFSLVDIEITDYVAAFVIFNPKISHLRTIAKTMKITNKKENIEHVSKLKTIDKTTLGTEKEIRTSLFERREISNLLLSPFSNHHWKVLYTNVDSNVSFICNSSTGIHHERCTVLGYLKLAEPNSVFILKNKSVLSDNVFLYTPFIKITNEHFNLEHLASVERDIHKKVVEEYFKGYVLAYADIAKLSRNKKKMKSR
jgi:hypothetical protein